jgi:hypothetical protein
MCTLRRSRQGKINQNKKPIMAYACSQPFEFSTSEQGISLIWDHPEYGPIPFLALPNDVEPHGVEIYHEAAAGMYGPVVSYADSHWYSTVDNNEWQGVTYFTGEMMISPTGVQPPNSTQTPPPSN